MIFLQTPSFGWSFQDGRQLASKPVHHNNELLDPVLFLRSVVQPCSNLVLRVCGPFVQQQGAIGSDREAPVIRAIFFFNSHATLLRCKLKSAVARITIYHPSQTLSRNKMLLLQYEK